MIRRLSRRLFQHYRSEAAALAWGSRVRFTRKNCRDNRRARRQLRAKSSLTHCNKFGEIYRAILLCGASPSLFNSRTDFAVGPASRRPQTPILGRKVFPDLPAHLFLLGTVTWQSTPGKENDVHETVAWSDYPRNGSISICRGALSRRIRESNIETADLSLHGNPYHPMLFNSYASLLVFLPLAVSMYWFADKSDRWRTWVLILLSLMFYGFWDVRFVPLMLGSIVINWWAAP
jgi:hypothetical protein